MSKITTFKRATKPVAFEPTYQADNTLLTSLLGQTINPVYVSSESVGGMPAIGRGVDMVSNAVAAMMSGADVQDHEGEHLPVPSVVGRPNMLYGTYDFWKMVTSSCMMRGNFIGILADYDDMGYARQIVPVHPDAVTMDTTTGIPIYQVHDTFYRYDEVVHIRSNAPTGGLWGLGIVERYRAWLEGALYEQEYGANTFKNGGVPSGVIKLETKKLDKDTAEAVQDSWLSAHGGSVRKPAVIGSMMDFTPIGWSAKDTEWIEGRKLSIAESALVCGLDPSDLSAAVGNTALTYANLTQRTLSRISDSYAPWLYLVEQAWTDLLPYGTVKGNPEALLRTSTAERYNLHKVAIEAGFMSIEEVRDLENLGEQAE